MTEMGWFENVKRRIQKFNCFIAGAGALFLIPLMVITALDVISRDVFNYPIPGTTELSQYLLAVFILLGLAYTQQAKAHVAVSMVTSRFPHSVQLILNIVAALSCLLLSCILVWQGWIIGSEEKTVSDMLRVPQYPFRLLVPLAAFLMGFEFLIDVGDSLKKLVRRAS
jgi:TRAP-type C4-dicarboxylate transport system permease small subunit